MLKHKTNTSVAKQKAIFFKINLSHSFSSDDEVVLVVHILFPPQIICNINISLINSNKCFKTYVLIICPEQMFVNCFYAKNRT